MKTLQLLVTIAVVVVVGLFVVGSATFTVDQSQQAIIVQFGEPRGEVISEPGLHWKRPFVQEVRYFDKRLLSWDGEAEEIPTLGREFILVDVTGRYRIVDPLLFLRTVRDEKGADLRLDDIIEAAVRNHISKTDLEDIVRSKDWKIEGAAARELMELRDVSDLTAPVRVGREELTRRIVEDARKQTAEYGIHLVDVRLKRVNYVQEVRQKVEDRMISERERIAETFRSEGRGRSAEILGEMQRDLSEIRSEAQRKAEEIRGTADAQVTKVYGEAYGADPEFFAFLRTLESYSQTINENTTLMLPANSEYYRYLREIGGGTPAVATP